jgi:hypothetical protein
VYVYVYVCIYIYTYIFILTNINFLAENNRQLRWKELRAVADTNILKQNNKTEVILGLFLESVHFWNIWTHYITKSHSPICELWAGMANIVFPYPPVHFTSPAPKISPRWEPYHLRDKLRYTTITGSLPSYGYGLDIWAVVGWYLAKVRIFLFSRGSIPALEPKRNRIKWYWNSPRE